MTAVDLIVVGFGAAGSAAAITAADLGYRVLVVERDPEDAHTPSTMMSGGLIMGATDGSSAAAYLDRCSNGLVPDDVSGSWAHEATGLRGWLTEVLGLSIRTAGGAEHPELHGSGAIDVLQIAPPGEIDPGAPVERLSVLAAGMNADQLAGTGVELFEALSTAVASRPAIEVQWGARARRLVLEAGVVAGVVVETDAGERTIMSRSGVVLACGGYEFDEDLKRNSLRGDPVYFYGSPSNTGDGIRMAQAVGAALWHMNQMVGRGVGHFVRGDGRELNVALRFGPPGYVLVDRHGRRFANESEQAAMAHGFYHELVPYSSTDLEFARIPSYWIFDERRRLAGPLVSTRTGPVRVGLYDWSLDNSKEIDAGWIASGTTPEAAAKAAGVTDAETVAATVAAYNAGCTAGSDEFGRPVETLVQLDAGPFYCVRVYPGGSNTSGGPARDAKARVLDPFGAPIPGLFAAGELGQATGELYPADGANLSEALCFGAIAARTALTPIL